MGAVKTVHDFFHLSGGERAFIVHTVFKEPGWEWYQEEFVGLCFSAGLQVVGRRTFKVRDPHPGTYFRSGHLEEILQELKNSRADILAVDRELTPIQQRELEKILPSRVYDRSAVILLIFGKRAHTKMAKTQVELAQCEWLLPRLKGMWRHFDKAGGKVGIRAGMGEKQIEVDRRLLKERIHRLRLSLKEGMRTRDLNRKNREREKNFRVAVVGYTNVGKSTLVSSLTGRDVFVADMPFATLDPLVRKAFLGNGIQILVTDTVGFVQNLPPSLLDAFRSTLEEARSAHVLLHVVDISRPDWENMVLVARKIFQEIGVDEYPVLYIFNKVDLLSSAELHERLPALASYQPYVLASLKEKKGLDAIQDWLIHRAFSHFGKGEKEFPFQIVSYPSGG